MDPIKLAGAITAGGAALGVIVWVMRGGWRMARRVQDIHGDLMGEPARPGVAARPGVMERMERVETALAQHIEQHPPAPPVTVNVNPPVPASAGD